MVESQRCDAKALPFQRQGFGKKNGAQRCGTGTLEDNFKGTQRSLFPIVFISPSLTTPSLSKILTINPPVQT